MEGYLGQFAVKQHDTKYADYTQTDWALEFIERYGGIDGAHHKTWVLDQVARILLGTEVIIEEARWDDGKGNILVDLRIWTNVNTPPQYKYWVTKMLGEEIDGEYEYDYDEGIAP